MSSPIRSAWCESIFQKKKTKEKRSLDETFSYEIENINNFSWLRGVSRQTVFHYPDESFENFDERNSDAGDVSRNAGRKEEIGKKLGARSAIDSPAAGTTIPLRADATKQTKAKWPPR